MVRSLNEPDIICLHNSVVTDKMKRRFFRAAVMSILLYECATWMLTKRMEKKLDGNYTRMLRPILNNSWRQHPTKQKLYGHLPPIMKTIEVRWTRHAGYCWRSRDKLIRDVLRWTPSYGRANAGRPARTYIQQLCANMGCNPEDLWEAMDDREGWWERVRVIYADGATWWWWWGWPLWMKDHNDESVTHFFTKTYISFCNKKRYIFCWKDWNSVNMREKQGQGDEGCGTQTGGGLLYWPFLNPHCDSIFRALYSCFFDERFLIGVC